MKFDLNEKYSKYADVLRFVEKKSREDLQRGAEELRPMWELTLADFFACCDGDFSCVLENDPKLWQVLWVESFSNFVTNFTDVCKRLTIEPTQEQKQAAQGCLPVEWQEGILIFARSYFGLHSFKDAERLTLADFILAKKHDYNTQLAERNMQKIQLKKLKK